MATNKNSVVVIILAVAVGVGYGVWKSSRNAKTDQAIADMKREQQALQAQMTQELNTTGTIDSAKAMERTRQFAAAVEKATANMSDHEAAMVRAMMKVMLDFNTEGEEYVKRTTAANEAGTFAPANLTTKEALDKADAELKWMKPEALRLEGLASDLPARVRTAVEAAGASSSEATSVLRGMEGQGRIQLMVKIRRCDRQMYDQMQKQLDILRAHLGKWKATDDGVVTFDDAAAQQEFNAAVEEFNRISTDQDQAIRSLVQMGG